jgi:hypothetical protein
MNQYRRPCQALGRVEPVLGLTRRVDSQAHYAGGLADL